jgi:hypothetical protein
MLEYEPEARHGHCRQSWAKQIAIGCTRPLIALVVMRHRAEPIHYLERYPIKDAFIEAARQQNIP